MEEEQKAPAPEEKTPSSLAPEKTEAPSENKSSGSPVALLLIFVVLVIVALAAWNYFKGRTPATTESSPTPTVEATNSASPSPMPTGIKKPKATKTPLY